MADELRELHRSNKTKHGHKDTKGSRNKRAKEVTLCLGNVNYDPSNNLGSDNYIFNFNSEVFDCDDIEVRLRACQPLHIVHTMDLFRTYMRIYVL